jgi:dTMP kinase
MAFLVLEGLDGSGKSTQNRLLREYLENQNINFRYLHFPRTGHGIFGELIARFLRGELGAIDQVNPWLVSLIYASDRNDAREIMQKWLSEGYLLVVDRYVMSNIAYQCAKLNSETEKEKLITWISELEYGYFNIPRPDLNVFLDVPFEFTKKNLGRERSGDERGYLMGRTDIHEADLDFQQKVRQVYLEQAGKDESLRLISCYDDKKGMLKPADIFQRIIDLLRKEKIL